jgi:hypothetical protein
MLQLVTHDTILEQPWMSTAEIAALGSAVDRLPDSTQLVEFGAGGSTPFILNHMKARQHLYSLEHEFQWYRMFVSRLSDPRLTLLLAERHLPKLYDIVPIEIHNELAAGLATYLNPTIAWDDVSFVLVDGPARGQCLALLLSRLQSNTTVLLHDYHLTGYDYDWVLANYRKVHLTDTLLELQTP